MLQHIYNDERGVTCFDRYFDHLTRVAHSWPPALRDFAQEDARYVLNGPRTLHDAWLCQLRVNKMNSPAVVTTTVELELELAADQSHLKLHYLDVSGLHTQLTPVRWPDKPVDLLVHEFSQDDEGMFRHVLVFDRGVHIDIRFGAFGVA